MTLNKLANESMLDFKYRLLIGKSKGEIEESWQEVFDALNIGLGIDSVKKGTIFLPEFEEYMINKLSPNNELPSYKDVLEIKGDGTTMSEKLVQMSDAESKDADYLLNAHGFDSNEFELVSAKHSVWNVSAGKDPNKTLYASKISVKPKVTGLNVEKLLEQLKLEPKYIETNQKQSDRMLEIPLVDMHWGINDWDYYSETLNEILELIESKHWDSIYIPIGNDLLHNDDFEGKTTSGTQIEKVDMEEAWAQAFNFYTEIYEIALMNSNEVVSHYVCGNHDKVMSWGLVKALEVAFPQVKWDTSIYNKKLFTWKEVAIIQAHGDKGAARLPKTILKEYGKLIADKKVVEVHTGHLHSMKSNDDFGVVYRTLTTKAQTDDWHAENSFMGAGKYFQLFEYKSDMLKVIHNV